MSILNTLKEKLASENIHCKIIQEYNGIYCMTASHNNAELIFIATDMTIEILDEVNVLIPIEDLDVSVKKIKNLLMNLQ